MRRRSILMTAAAMLAAASLAVAGCGDDDSAADTSTPAAATTAPDTSDTVATTPATTAPATATKVAVVLGKPKELSLVAVPAEIPAGPTTFVVANKGEQLHEMVVVPSDAGAAGIRNADGTANEEGSLGEVADVEPGGGGQLTVTMPAGKYVLLCAIPGHFEGGMYQNFVVK